MFFVPSSRPFRTILPGCLVSVIVIVSTVIHLFTIDQYLSKIIMTLSLMMCFMYINFQIILCYKRDIILIFLFDLIECCYNPNFSCNECCFPWKLYVEKRTITGNVSNVSCSYAKQSIIKKSTSDDKTNY